MTTETTTETREDRESEARTTLARHGVHLDSHRPFSLEEIEKLAEVAAFFRDNGADGHPARVRFADFYTATYGDVGNGARALTVETEEPMEIRPLGDRRIIIKRA